jgi:outer membrane biosynthesis protein TonB
MILEQIIGDVVATITRETGEKVTLKVGDYFSEHERSSLETKGTGKLEIRIDPNCTIEIRCTAAVEEVVVPTPAPTPISKTAPTPKPAPAPEPIPEPTPEEPKAE